MGGASAMSSRGVVGVWGISTAGGSSLTVVVLAFIVVASSSCGCGWCRGQLRCHDDEKTALLELGKESSPGNLQYFGEDNQEDCCRWSGIDCSSHTGRIIGIDLFFGRVAESDGTLWHPNFTSLVRFRELERLWISGQNRIGSTSLNVLCNLKYLKELRLDIVNLEGPVFPQCLCNMRSLTSLYIDGDEEVGMASCLGNLHNLESLALFNIKIIDSMTFLEDLCNLKYLKALFLDGIFGSSVISEGPIIPQCLCNMRSLTTLVLFANSQNTTMLRVIIPSCLGNLHNLETLTLWNAKIIDSMTFLDGLCNLKYLNALTLNNIFGGALSEGPILPQCFCNMRSLTSLQLDRVGGIPSCMGNLHNLENLLLKGIENFGNVTFLESKCT